MSAVNAEARKVELLSILWEHYINSGEMPLREQFRVDHHPDVKLLNELEFKQILQPHNQRYRVPIYHLLNLETPIREREVRITNAVLACLREVYRKNIKISISVAEIQQRAGPGVDAGDIQRALYYLDETGFLGGHTPHPKTKAYFDVKPGSLVNDFGTIEEKLAQDRGAETIANDFIQTVAISGKQVKSKDVLDALWSELAQEYGDTKAQFGKSINFVQDPFRREVLFRDIAHARGCLNYGYYKSAVVLAGGVIEELLRLYLESKAIKPEFDKFEKYIVACQEKGLLKISVAKLGDSVRDFRNLIHLAREKSGRFSISKATAQAALAAVFTVSHDFE